MKDDLTNAVAAALKEKPVAALEDIAALAGASVADVVRHLPEGEATCIGGDQFEAVMTDITNWGEITFIVNTGDVIFEAKAPLPKGSMGHGFYNLHGKPIGGHLKASACDMIAFVSRSFMGKQSHSVQFYNADGGCMFKIYLGRDSGGQFIEGQPAAFAALRDGLVTE